MISLIINSKTISTSLFSFFKIKYKKETIADTIFFT